MPLGAERSIAHPATPNVGAEMTDSGGGASIDINVVPLTVNGTSLTTDTTLVTVLCAFTRSVKLPAPNPVMVK